MRWVNCVVADHRVDPAEVEEFELTTLTMRFRYWVCAHCRGTRGHLREEIEFRLAKRVEEGT